MLLLENKVAVIHGGGGSIGGAAARVFAREGARLFLAGKSLPRLERLLTSFRFGTLREVLIAGGWLERES